MACRLNFVSRGLGCKTTRVRPNATKRRHEQKVVVSMKLLCSRGSQQQGKNRDKPARLQKKQKGAPRKVFCPYYLCNKHRLPFVGTHNKMPASAVTASQSKPSNLTTSSSASCVAPYCAPSSLPCVPWREFSSNQERHEAVSYTHLTLPTICSV